jgi:hypothetical protein
MHYEPGSARQRHNDNGQPALIAPSKELAAGPGIGPACVPIADIGGKELDERQPAWSPRSAIIAGATFAAVRSEVTSACWMVVGS